MTSTLPPAARNHYSIMLDLPGGRQASRRYAQQDTVLVAFGDGPFQHVPDGTATRATIPEIGGHGIAAGFDVTVRDLPGTAVSDETLQKLLEHVPLGRTIPEVESALVQHRDGRRFVAIEAR